MAEEAKKPESKSGAVKRLKATATASAYQKDGLRTLKKKLREESPSDT